MTTSIDIFSKNIKFLEKKNSELTKKLCDLDEINSEFVLEESKSGDAILLKNNIAIDDETDPVWDSLEKYNNLKHKKSKSITVIYGVGLGYIVKEFAKRHKGKIIIYEPDLETLKVSFSMVDFTEELKKENITITSTLEEVKKAYELMFFWNYEFNKIFSKYYVENFPKEVEEFDNEIEKNHGVYQSNYSNLISKTAVWTYPVFHNIPATIKNPDLHILKDKFKGKTVIIISAGPSLDKNIKDLLPYRDKVVVMCAGTAYRTAIKNGIIPDFAISIEISKNTKAQLDTPEISQVNLITATNSYHGIFDLPAKRIFNYHNNKTSATRWLGNVLEVPINLYETAGTVALSAFYAAKMMGFETVIYIGQDLAYTGNKCYSKDSLYADFKVNKESLIESTSIDNIAKQLESNEQKVSKHIEDLGKGLISVKSPKGEQLITRPDMLLFSIYFEDVAQKFGNEIKLINATEGGMYLSGYEHITLKEALEKYTENFINVEVVLNSVKISSKKLKERKKIVLAHLGQIIKNYFKTKDIINNIFNDVIYFNFSEETRSLFKIITTDYSKNFDTLYLKHLKGEELNDEDKKLQTKRKEVGEKYIKAVINDFKKLFENNFNKFSKDIKVLNENYFKLKSVINADPFITNMIFNKFLVIDNLIKDLDNSEEECVELFKELASLFVVLKLSYPEYIKFIQRIVSKIEKV